VARLLGMVVVLSMTTAHAWLGVYRTGVRHADSDRPHGTGHEIVSPQCLCLVVHLFRFAFAMS
jgi:hypothetical protein